MAKAKAKVNTVKFAKLKKAKQLIAKAKAFKITKAQGKLTFALKKAVKGSKSFKKYFAVGKKTGKVAVRKGLAKGTYTLTFKVRAAGNANYKALTKTVKLKVKVR